MTLKLRPIWRSGVGAGEKISTTTDIYGHSFDDSVERAAEAMDEIMGEVLEE